MKNIKSVIISLAALAVAFSCAKEEGRVPDTGDLKMGIVMPGNSSVVVCGYLKPGSGAKRVEVSWSDAPAVGFDVTGESFRQTIPVAEGSYVFRVKAFDAGGRQVIDFPMAGRSYGENYIGTLKNRVPLEYKRDGDNVVVNWGPAAGLRSTISYTRSGADTPVELPVASSDTQTVLEGFEGDEFFISSYFYPDMMLYDPATRPVSVPSDFVYPEFPSTPMRYSLSGPVDITVNFLKNAGPNIAGTERGGDNNKWGVPVDWNFTPNLRNQAGNTLGGWKWENDEVQGVIHFESQNWEGPGFENGKVWQTVTLPAGTYSFTAHYRAGDGSPQVNMNTVAAIGEQLPNIADFGTAALGFKPVISGTGGAYPVYFTLAEEASVSLGLVVTIEGSNHWQQFSHFTLAEIPVIDVTASYIKNSGPGMDASEILASDNRWGILKDWQTNAAAKNQGNQTVGGWKGGGIGWEVGWGAASITNGKVWQSATLPAGTYQLSIGHGGVMDANVVNLNLVIAPGSELPDVADLARNSIAYMNLPGPGGTRTITFTLPEDRQVSIGILIDTTAGDSWVDAASWVKLVKLTLE